MSKRGVVVATVLALLLGVITILTDQPRGTRPTAAAGPLLGDLDIGTITQIRVKPPTGGETVLSRVVLLPDMWVLGNPGNDLNSPRWPVNARSVFATLRLLTELNIDPNQGPGSGEFASLVLSGSGGKTVEVRIGVSPLAGQTHVWLPDGRAALVQEAGLARAFASPNLDAWYVTELLPFDPTTASRLSIIEGDAKLTLSRVGKNWAITSPISADADGPIITSVLSKLAQSAATRITRLGGQEAAIKLLGSKGTILVETDRRRADGEPEPISQVINLCGTADVSGGQLSCVLAAWIGPSGQAKGEKLWGEVACTVDRSAFAGLVTDPAAYISRETSRVTPADVGRARISEIRGGRTLDLTREQGLWTATGGERIEPGPAATADALIKFLTAERAQTVLIGPAASFEPGVRIVLSSPGEIDLLECEVGVLQNPATGKSLVATRKDNIVRAYDRPGAQLGKLLGFE